MDINNSSEKKSFTSAFLIVADMCGKEVSEDLINFYMKSFSKYSLENILMALSKHTKDHKHGSFFPKIADIMRHLEPSKEDNSLALEMKAEEQWEIFMRKIGAWGANNASKRLDDKTASAVIEHMGGGAKIGKMNADSEQFKWVKKEFVKNYVAFNQMDFEQLPQIAQETIKPIAIDNKNIQRLMSGVNKLESK